MSKSSFEEIQKQFDWSLYWMVVLRDKTIAYDWRNDKDYLVTIKEGIINYEAIS